MKLLFDENISDSLCNLLGDLFPDALHVRKAGLQGATDASVWEYANLNGFAIVSKDSDFMERAVMAEDPIKVIWIRLGNCSTANIHLLMRNKSSDIIAFFKSNDIVLELP